MSPLGPLISTRARPCAASGLWLDEKRIVFVDNGSTDGSAELVAAGFPGVLLLRNDRNFGYGAATNQGIELALKQGAEYVYSSSPKVIVCCPSARKL